MLPCFTRRLCVFSCLSFGKPQSSQLAETMLELYTVGVRGSTPLYARMYFPTGRVGTDAAVCTGWFLVCICGECMTFSAMQSVVHECCMMRVEPACSGCSGSQPQRTRRTLTTMTKGYRSLLSPSPHTTYHAFARPCKPRPLVARWRNRYI